MPKRPKEKMVKKSHAMKGRQVMKRPATSATLKSNTTRGTAWISGGSSATPRRGTPIDVKTARSYSTRAPQTSGKRGTRLMAERPPQGKMFKRPAAAYSPGPPPAPQDRTPTRSAALNTKHTLEKILRMGEKQLTRELVGRGHIPTMRRCPVCGKGSLSRMYKRGVNMSWVRRCSARDCHRRVSIVHKHPVFVASAGGGRIPLSRQAAVLHCAVWGVPISKVPALVEGVQRKAIDGVYRRWRACLTSFVKHKQEQVKFGVGEQEDKGAGKVDEVEVDEGVIRRNPTLQGDVQWTEYVALKRRGDRQSLVLAKRPAANTITARAREARGRAVPPPMTVAEWHDVRSRYITEGTLVHSDGARAYRANGPGILHDYVVHGTSGGRRRATYVKSKTHTLPNGSQYKATAGTQCLDSVFGHVKRNLVGVHAAKSEQVEYHVREAQWFHWVGSNDRWLAAADVIRARMKSVG